MNHTQRRDRSALVAEIIDVCHRMYRFHLVAATDGSVSVRLDNRNILVTRTGLNKGLTTEADLVEVNAEGVQASMRSKPSTELAMHLFIYRERKDVNAVVHAHPPYATGFAVARIPLDQPILPEVSVGLGSIPLAPYATPSTEEVPLSIAPFIQNHSAILLANHGVVSFGSDLMEAYFRMEKVEHVAHTLFVAAMLGGAHHLTPSEVEKLNRVALTTYGIDLSKRE